MRLMIKFLLLFVLALSPSFAYNYSWSTHEDITTPNPDNNPGECDGSECEGEPDPCNGGRQGSPVYLKTGHFTWSETDVALNGTPSISLQRNYTSHEPRSGLFGNGWISNFERSIVKTIKTQNIVFTVSSGGSAGSGSVNYIETPTPLVYYIFRHPNGLRYTFKMDVNGTLQVPRGLFNSVETLGNDSFVFNYPDASKEVYKDGNLVSRSDRNGNTTFLTYDNNALLQQVHDEKGRSLTFFYNSQGYVSEVMDHTSRSWLYSYDGSGNLISVTNPLDGTRSYEYANYKPAYDAQNYSQITKITDESGRVVTSVTYSGETVKTYTEGQNKYTYTFNLSSRSATKVDSANSNYGFNWDESGLVTRRVDPLGNAITYQRDENLTLLGYTDQLGNVWSRTVDSIGRTQNQTTPLGHTTNYAYIGKNPYPNTITSPLSHVTTFKYDANYNPIGLTDAEGHTRSTNVNLKGEPLSITDAKGNVTTFTYNDHSQPVTITDALNRTTTLAYDNLGRVVTATDAKGNDTNYEYDALDRLVKTTNALGHSITYTYDATGNLLSLTDPVGNITLYIYDDYGRVSSITRPDGKASTYTYRTDNLVSSINRYDGKVVVFTYDANKRLVSEDVSGDTISYAYNAKGELTAASNGNSSLAFSYDNDGRVIQSNQNGLVVAYDYDAEGSVNTLSFLNNAINYSRNKLGLATQITSGAGSFNFTYDQNGIESGSTLPNGITNTFNFNAAYELTQVTSGSDTLNYTHDNIGLITSKSINGQSTNYSYDAIGRLTQDGAISNSYDVAGNNQNNAAVYDMTTNQLTSTDAYSFIYDSYGNVIRKTSLVDNSKKIYIWNARNQLISVQTQDENNLSTHTLVFTYDALGRRASKTVDGFTQNYLYDGQDIIAITDTDNNPVSIITHDERTDTPISIVTGSESFYYQRDHQGSILSLTDGSQNKVEEFIYTDAYGVTQKTHTVATNNPYAYTGREFDEEDLYYYRARYYDPTMQRFLSEDPIGYNSGDFNFYRYVGNNPTNYIDPSGNFFFLLYPAVPAGLELLGWLGLYAALNPPPPLPYDLNPFPPMGDFCPIDNSPYLSNKDKMLSPGEIDRLKKGGEDIHDLKGGKNASKRDLYKNKNGDIFVKPKGGRGPGDPTGLNINDF